MLMRHVLALPYPSPQFLHSSLPRVGAVRRAVFVELVQNLLVAFAGLVDDDLSASCLAMCVSRLLFNHPFGSKDAFDDRGNEHPWFQRTPFWGGVCDVESLVKLGQSSCFSRLGKKKGW